MVRLTDGQIRLEKAKAMGIKVHTCNVEECDQALLDAQLRAVVEDLEQKIGMLWAEGMPSLELEIELLVLKNLKERYKAELEEAPDDRG